MKLPIRYRLSDAEKDALLKGQAAFDAVRELVDGSFAVA